MNSIFISYAAEDRERAKQIAHALEQRGWPVWWDRKIPLGKSFDTVIEENLARAQCVLVLWTKASVESRWVRAEASDAAARDVLIPVLLEAEVKLPLEFKLLQAAQLTDWHGEADHPGWQALLSHIEAMLNASHAAVPGEVGGDASMRPSPHQAGGPAGTGANLSRPTLRHALLFILLPTALLGAAALGLMYWRTPTRVQLDVVVDRAAFAIAGEQPVELPAAALNFRILSIENYDRIRFTPARLSVDSAADTEAARALGSGEVVLTGAANTTPLATISGIDVPAGGAGRLEPLLLEPGSEVILQAGEAGGANLTVRVDNQDLSTSVLPTGMLELSVVGARVGAYEARATPLLMRVSLPPHAPFVSVQGTRRPFVVSATLDGEPPMMLGERVRIARAEFLKQGADGAPQSALVAPGQIAYPDYPDLQAVALRAADLVGVGDMVDTSLSRLQLQADGAGLAVRLEGVVGRIETVSGGARRDHRLTWFDRLWHGPRSAVLLAVLAWGISVCAGAYRLYRELATAR